jgi:hypothetical protein
LVVIYFRCESICGWGRVAEQLFVTSKRCHQRIFTLNVNSTLC